MGEIVRLFAGGFGEVAEGFTMNEKFEMSVMMAAVLAIELAVLLSLGDPTVLASGCASLLVGMIRGAVTGNRK
jgi:hypothetical protein